MSPRSLGAALLRVITLGVVLTGLVGGSAFLVWTLSPSSVRFGFHGQLVAEGPSPTLAPGETTAYTVRFRNTGFVPWQRGGDKQVTLGISDGAMGAVDPRLADHWLSPSRIGTTVEDVVLPGMIGTFTFNVRAPATAGVYRVPMGLVVDGLGWFEESPFILVVTSDLGFHSHLLDQSLHPTLIPGELSAPLVVRFRNTGAKAWMRGVVGQQANLGVVADDGSAKALAGWPTADRVAIQAEPRVGPGGIATFTFRLRAHPAGLTCTLLQSPAVTFGAVAYAAQKAPFVTGGGRFVHDCPSGTGTYLTNFAVNVQTKDGVVGGSFHMKVPDNQCVNGGSVKTHATCLNVYAGTPGTYRAWLTSFVTDVDGPYFQVPYGVAEGEYMRSGFQDSSAYGDAVNFQDANNSTDCATPDNTHYPVHGVVDGKVTARPAA